MLDALTHAENALLGERRPLTRAEVDAVAALSLDHLPDLIALAHKVRLAYSGPGVELESLINAKSGACPLASTRARSAAPVPSTQVWPPASCTTGWPKARHRPARSSRSPRTSAASRPRGNGRQTSPWHRPSGFQSQPVARRMSSRVSQSDSPSACACGRLAVTGWR